MAEVPPGPWVKAHSVAATARATGCDTLVIADADVWADNLAETAAAANAAGWAIPHHLVHRLTEQATALLLDGHSNPHELATAEPPYRGVAGGGIVALTAQLLERVPMDPRFRGWGQEDESWGTALRAIAGPPWRADRPLLHLWHPPQPRESRKVGNRDGWALRRRYARARRDPEQMARLLAEVRQCSPTC